MRRPSSFQVNSGLLWAGSFHWLAVISSFRAQRATLALWEYFLASPLLVRNTDYGTAGFAQEPTDTCRSSFASLRTSYSTAEIVGFTPNPTQSSFADSTSAQMKEVRIKAWLEAHQLQSQNTKCFAVVIKELRTVIVDRLGEEAFHQNLKVPMVLEGGDCRKVTIQTCRFGH